MRQIPARNRQICLGALLINAERHGAPHPTAATPIPSRSREEPASGAGLTGVKAQTVPLHARASSAIITVFISYSPESVGDQQQRSRGKLLRWRDIARLCVLHGEREGRANVNLSDALGLGAGSDQEAMDPDCLNESYLCGADFLRRLYASSDELSIHDLHLDLCMREFLIQSSRLSGQLCHFPVIAAARCDQ
jgi:hypothetical protein